MKITKRIIPCFMVFATLLSCFVVPVHAEDGDGNGTDYTSKPNFWSWAYQNSDFLQNTVGNIYGDIDHACSQSSDGRHHASGYSKDLGNGTFLCKCNECGEDFKAYAKQIYNDTVDNNGIGSIDSSGSFVWYPHVAYLNTEGTSFLYGDSRPYRNSDNNFTLYNFSNPSEAALWFMDWDSYHLVSNMSVNSSRVTYFIEDTFPVDGVYSLLSEKAGSGSTMHSGTSISIDLTFANGWHYWKDKNGVAGVQTTFCIYVSSRYTPSVDPYSSPACTGYNLYLVRPHLKVVPASGGGNVTNQIYAIDYRPTSITAPITYTDNTGQINVTTGDVHLFSENDMTLTNPQTNTTTPVTDWSYDYTTRTYDLTLDTGEHSTVTYGDENITIKEGDTTYIYNYYVQPSNDDPIGGGGSNDPTHKHEYTSEVTRQASCTVAGQETLTCSCGDTQTKTIPALGHDWVIKEQVNSEYDENGEETVKGYTIYKCSRCGEEKKSTDGTPPDSGGGAGKPSIWQKLGDLFGAIGNGVIDIITAAISKLLDGLIHLAEVISEKLSAVVEMVLSWFDSLPQMFEGFLAFLASVFGFLPPEIVILMTFGFALVIFIGIIKAISPVV